jgi:type II secretory pathway pseudopilin PulG
VVRKLLSPSVAAMKMRSKATRTVFYRPAEEAFTLTDILVASGILVVIGATAMYALSLTNKNAVGARVQTAAQSIVQNQIDQILIKGPYVPTNVPPDIPAVLKTGTTVASNVPVFTDSETGTMAVSGTLTTTIQDSGASVKGTPLYVLKASVTLDYSLGGQSHKVVMNTMRAPDQ